MRKILGVGLFGLLSITFLGGSAVWHLLGFADSFEIAGSAPVVAPPEATKPTQWTSYGGDKGGQRWTTSTQIDPDNVGNLAVAWEHSSGLMARADADLRSKLALEATPIFIGDALVYCTQLNEVIALSPDTGEVLWRHDPEIDREAIAAGLYTCRGVSYWESKNKDEEACGRRILIATMAAQLIALDAKTGQLCTDFGEQGIVKVRPSKDLIWAGEMAITSAPAILGDIVITGTAISDNIRSDAPVGTVYAYDVRSGAPLWEFNPIPQSLDDPAAESWGKGSNKSTGHANVWSTISIDEDRGLVFLPTSSPSPDLYGGDRPGDNRYANSVVALNGSTGEVEWHFQAVHHDIWDYDLPAQPGLYSVYRDDEHHDVVAQVTKMGLIFVLDRDTGEPFLPIEERPVPQRSVEGEVLSPTQPFPSITPNVVKDHLSASDAFGVTIFDRAWCASRIAGLRSDGIYTPPTEQGSILYPFQGGGANWGSSAYDPSRNLLIVNMSNVAGVAKLFAKDDPASAYKEHAAQSAEDGPMQGAPYAMTRSPLLSPLGLPCIGPPWGVLAGIDLATGKIVWRRKLGTTEDIAPGGLALNFGVPNLGGPMTTASGLTFIGAAMDNYIRAFDNSTGDELWKSRLPGGGQATPMSYEFNGRQYVVIAAGGNARLGTTINDRIVAFALPRD